MSLAREETMPRATARYREIVVSPGNSWREAVYLLAAFALLALLSFIRVELLPAKTPNMPQQSYHRLDTNLNDTERTIYQAMRSSQTEVMLLWESAEGAWPAVSLLHEEGIPPFAVDLVPGALKEYTWTMYDRGPWVDYLGVSAQKAAGGPSALMRLINLHADFHPHPHPGLDYDPEQRGAVQIWLHPENGQLYAGMQLAERGWAWIVSADDPVLARK